MKRIVFLIIILPLFFMLSLRYSNAAIMEDYCQVPPYVIQNVSPSVMIILDNSLSMKGFAYHDGMDTTDPGDDKICDVNGDGISNDYPCTCSGDPCTGFLTPGDYPTHKYYGYFNPDYWYTYDLSRFTPTAPKTGSGLSGARAKAAAEWDGNFLNWLTMRRVDIVRKVLTGGRSTGTGPNTRLLAEMADLTRRGIYKQIANAENYVNNTYSGTRCFRFDTGGSGTSTFDVLSTSSCTSAVAKSNVSVDISVPTGTIEGVLQRVVGARARLGLTFYSTTNQGGKVARDVRGDNCPGGDSFTCVVNDINNTSPSTNTPVGESLWTATGYFAQQASISGGPGPRYNSGDFQINNNNDPYNYGTGGQPRYPTCAEGYVLLLTDGEPCSDGYLPDPSIENYASGRSDYNCTGTNCPAAGPFAGGTIPACGPGENVAGIEDVALWAHTTDLRSSTLGSNNISGTQNLTLYTVFAFGKNSTLLRYATINGGFEDADGSNTPNQQSEWDANNDGEPDTYYEADEGYALEQAVENALSNILKRAASGTAASVLAAGEGYGANLVQAVFYPRRAFGSDVISWTSSLQNLWYYVDPLFTNSSIREDTEKNQEFHLINDYIVQFYYDAVAQQTKARRWQDTDGDGAANGTKLDPDIKFEDLSSLWEAGKLLWSRDLASDPRIIYTTIDGSTLLSGNFSTGTASTLAPYLQATDVNGNGSNQDEAEYIIRYMHGEGLTTEDLDKDGVNDIIGVDLNGDGADDFRRRTVTIDSDTHVWKLGDILNSTPKIASWIPLNWYHIVYHDTTYGPPRDVSFFDAVNPNQFVLTPEYKNRGMVFTGGNDGMLHAFKLGKLEIIEDGTNIKARLSGNNLGKEMWAFIPKNALPYLKYFMDPDYCHIYTIDLPPFLFDASIGAPGAGDVSNNVRTVNDWRTILIGGMRTGGACRGTTTSCTDVSGDSSKDCVNTPVDVSGSSVGYSSYFALDITDFLATQNDPNPSPPQLLWEFSNPQLGFATTGPAVVRVGGGSGQSTPDDKNGKWFVVFGSGPTGPIDTTNNQFLGRSDQNLRLFVLDLKTGNLSKTIDTGIPYAFAGSMINSTYDHRLDDYQDDALYIGYVKRTGTNPNYTWTNGGVGRLVTKEDSDPDNWAWSIVLDNIGPVTSSVTHLYDTNPNAQIAWLYFGTGRYYFEQGPSADDQNSQRRLFGIKEPCAISAGTFDSTCTTQVSVSGSACPVPGFVCNVTNIGDVPTKDAANSSNFKGWYINLDGPGSFSYCDGYDVDGSCAQSSTKNYFAERMITDPLSSTTGNVFFTTYKPYNDECGLGGKSSIWAVRYSTGGAPSGLQGKALLQVSTGSIEQMDLSSVFTEAGGRKTSAIEGVPPTSQGLAILSPPAPIKRTIHIKER